MDSFNPTTKTQQAISAAAQAAALAGNPDVGPTHLLGALLAQGLPAEQAAVAGAVVHGLAGREGPVRGLVASDLVTALPTVLGRLDRGA